MQLTQLTISQISQNLNIPYFHVLSIATYLEYQQICQIKLAVMINCQLSPVDTLPFGHGFPNYKKCPVCQQDADFNYDFIIENIIN